MQTVIKSMLDIPAATHIKEASIAAGGFFATLVSDVTNSPHWLTLTLGILTAIYTLFKIGIVALAFRKKWRHRNDAETRIISKDE